MSEQWSTDVAGNRSPSEGMEPLFDSLSNELLNAGNNLQVGGSRVEGDMLAEITHTAITKVRYAAEQNIDMTLTHNECFALMLLLEERGEFQ